MARVRAGDAREFAAGAYEAAAPALVERLLRPIMPALTAKAAEAGRAAYEAMKPELERKAREAGRMALMALAVAIGTGVVVWLAFRRK